MSDFKKAIPEHDFENFDDKQARQAWFASSGNDTNHLVMRDTVTSNAISGLEFDQLIYIYPTCLKCGREYSGSSIISRAKALLIMSSYGVKSCQLCYMKSYEDMKWNSKVCQWELNQGIQKWQMSEEPRKVFEETTELRNRLEPNEIIKQLKHFSLY